MKKLYTVNVQADFVVWAGSPEEAERVARSNLQDGYYNYDVETFTTLPPDYDDDALVWGHEGDKTIGELRGKVK